MSDLNLKQLRVFIEAVESKSFTGAAKKLYLSQSTVSNHIQSLEEELGVTLFRREAKKNIQLTPEGNGSIRTPRYYLRCDTRTQHCRVYRLMRSSGRFNSSSQPIIPEFISEFINVHPDSAFTIRDGDSEQIHQLLIDGRFRSDLSAASIIAKR